MPALVTHPGSPPAPTAEPVLSSRRSAGVEPMAAAEAAQTQWRCPERAGALCPWRRPRIHPSAPRQGQWALGQGPPLGSEDRSRPLYALAAIEVAKPRPRQRTDADLHQRCYPHVATLQAALFNRVERCQAGGPIRLGVRAKLAASVAHAAPDRDHTPGAKQVAHRACLLVTVRRQALVVPREFQLVAARVKHFLRGEIGHVYQGLGPYTPGAS